MKIHIFIMLFVCFCTRSYGQLYIDGENIDNQGITFCEIIETNINFLKKQLIVLDESTDYNTVITRYNHSEKDQLLHISYGQALDMNHPQSFQDKNRKEIYFSSAIDALNFLASNGWEYISSYNTIHKDVYMRRLLLQKKK